VLARNAEDCQAFGEVGFHPRGQLRCRLLITVDKPTEFFFRVMSVGGIEDVANIIRDLLSHFEFRGVMHRVLCQVKLTTLPRNTCERCLTSCLEPFVGIADNQLHTVHAAFLQRREKLTPMHFGFGERHADAQHAAMAAGLDSDRDQDRTITDATGDANFLIASIDDEILNFLDRAVSPSFEFIVTFAF